MATKGWLRNIATPLPARVSWSRRIGTRGKRQGSGRLVCTHYALPTADSSRRLLSSCCPRVASQRKTVSAGTMMPRRSNELLSSTYLSHGAARPTHSVPTGRAAPPLNNAPSAAARLGRGLAPAGFAARDSQSTLLLQPRIVAIQGYAGEVQIPGRS